MHAASGMAALLLCRALPAVSRRACCVVLSQICKQKPLVYLCILVVKLGLLPVLFKKHVLLNGTSLMLLMLGLQEKVKRMTPEQRAKFKAREERVQTKRAMKQRMIRA